MRYPLSGAQQIAQKYIERLRLYCKRIEVAGSIRRRKPDVGDIEIVAIPKMSAGLFGDMPVEMPKLGHVVLDGPRQKKYILPEGIELDLFLVLPPAEWGVMFTLRTGPWQFSKQLVTQRYKRGLLPSDMVVKDGCLWRGDIFIPTPEEIDFFREINLKWIPPPNR